VLGLEDNAISSWQEVLRLAGLPNLQRLALSGNPISSIAYPAAAISTAALFSTSPPDPAGPSGQQQQQATASPPAGGTADCQQQPQEQQQQQQAPFARLQALLLGDCRISSWADVDQLDRFPALRELRLSGNPLFSAEGCGAGGGRRFEVSASKGPQCWSWFCPQHRRRRLLHAPHTAGFTPAFSLGL
jgi:Leucine-rich repeat (LRR) protein